MSVFLGGGEYKYKVLDDRAKLPENWPYSFGDETKPKYLKTLQKLERVLN